MARKNCPECGSFMSRTDLMAQDDEFDTELAKLVGLSDEQIQEGMWNSDSPFSHFTYMGEKWECNMCGTIIELDEPRFWWNPETGHYDGERPLTVTEQAQAFNQTQEAAGQMRLEL